MGLGKGGREEGKDGRREGGKGGRQESGGSEGRELRQRASPLQYLQHRWWAWGERQSHPLQPTLAQHLAEYSVQFSCSVVSDSLRPHDCSTSGFLVLHHLPEFTQTHVCWVSHAIQPFHPLLSPSPPTFNLSQHQGLSQWVSSSNQVAKVLEFQLQHQSFQWIFRTDIL